MTDAAPRHGPIRYSSYFAIHAAILQRHKAHGFVCDDALVVRDLRDILVLEGEIGCLGQIVIAVYKLLDVVDVAPDNQRIVQTSSYSYNVFMRGRHNIFRYDDNHPDCPYPGHETRHHKHEFDWLTGNPLRGSPRCVGTDWPLLTEVIAEAQTWYYAHFHEVPSHDCAGDLQSEIVR